MSSEFITDLILSKAEKCKQSGDMEFKFHYLMINSEYGHSNHNYIKEIYENIDDVEEAFKQWNITLLPSLKF